MIRSVTAFSAAMLLAGCASIINGQTQAIAFQSEPVGASITVTNKAGESVHSGTTPTTVSLKRGAGYFQPESYTIQFTKQGFKPKEVVITGALSGWYFGNILIGGVIGMVAVDPVTGGMYAFPDAVSAPMEAASSPVARGAMELKVVTLASLSPAARARAKLVGHLN